ncbi:hypothetical protein [Burkholderia cenocepacia]|uniref:hypothetical protein n=1 Tax=Burkholderia cenocepacia TaxID=95486 RepID=UPI00158C7410|nr:hypothetical protein [Burkholderia cenocepacia]
MDTPQKLVEQLGEAFVAPVSALQIAFVHLVQQMNAAGIINKELLAKEIENSAKVQQSNLKNAEAIARHLFALAQQLRDAETTSGPASLQ